MVYVSILLIIMRFLILTDSKAKNKQKKQEDPPFDEMGFTSTVIVPDEPSVSKLTPQTKQPSPPVVKPEDGEGKTPKKIELALRRS